MITGAIISIVGSVGLLLSFLIYAWYTLQIIPKIMIPLFLVAIPLVCSIAMILSNSATTIRTLAYVALVYPAILLFGTGTYITACALVMGFTSIPIVIVLLFIFALLTFSGTIVSVVR